MRTRSQDLSDVLCIDHERRTKIDMVFEKVIDHVDAEIKRCPACGATIKGVFPPDIHGLLQYGDGLKTFVINLLIGQMVALNRVQKLVKSMIGDVIVEVSLLKFVLRLHQAWQAGSSKLSKRYSIHPRLMSMKRLSELT